MTAEFTGSQAVPFSLDYRASGVLLHITSLPSAYGIGDFGPTAYRWIDCLAEAGQSWWQLLPLGTTGLGNSPYQSRSTFALNPFLVSPDLLIEDGLLQASDIPAPAFSPTHVEYDAVALFKHNLLSLAWERFVSGAAEQLREEFERFCIEQGHWLDDYVLFEALKVAYHDAYYLDWPQELVRRDPPALAQVQLELSELVDRFRFEQFLLFRQLEAMRRYANERHVWLMGDLPFFISADSADVWSHPELFLLDEHQHPRVVGGVPPDYFSADGQRWGNPVYDWEVLRRTGYRWWIDRLRVLLSQVDVLRLDHFRGFAAAWHIPAGSPTARTGHWEPGPGEDFFNVVREALGGLPFVAEDLGMITDDVRELRKQFDLPGMLVLQFAFDGDPLNPFLPANYGHNAVVYTGTHDNNTTRGWYDTQTPAEREVIWRMLQREPVPPEHVAWEFIREAWNSAAALAIAPLQDVLNLGSEARMNIPGQAEGNWDWRFTWDMLDDSAFQRLHALTAETGRAAKRRP